MDDLGFPRTPDRPVKLLGTRVRYQRSVETTIDAQGPDFIGGSAIEVDAKAEPEEEEEVKPFEDDHGDDVSDIDSDHPEE